MYTRTPEIHDHLPLRLTLTNSGEPRKQLPSISNLSVEDLTQIKIVRNRLLELYFPPSCRNEYAPVRYGYLEQNYGETLFRTAGEVVYTYPRRDGDGRQPEGREYAAHLYVSDDWEGRPTWKASLQMWMRHLSGGDSVFAVWEEENDRTCILVDLDVASDRRRDIHEIMPEVTAPWREAVSQIERETDTQLHAEWMESGSKGCWLQLFLSRPVTKRGAAEFVLGLAARVAVNHRVEVKPQILNLSSDRNNWERALSGSRSGDLTWTVDSGSLRNAPCRLPFATHASTRRSAVFLRDGVIIPDQVSHLLAIERTNADIDDLARHLRPAWIPPSRPRPLDNLAHRLVVTEDENGEDDGDDDDLFWATADATASAVAAPDDGGNDTAIAEAGSHLPSGLSTTPSIEGGEEREELTIVKMSLCRSGWLNHSGMGGQRVTSMESILGLEVASIPLDSLIPPLQDGNTNSTLIDEHLLDRVYGWMRRNRGEFTIDDVTDELMKHYMGSESGKRAQIRATVKSGMDGGRHLRANPDRWTHPCVAVCREIAEAQGIEQSSRVFRVLVYLAYKGWRHEGRAQVTALEIAKSLGLTPSSAREDNSSQLAIGRDLRKLRELGIIDRTVTGFPGKCSVYVVYGIAEHQTGALGPNADDDCASPCSADLEDEVVLCGSATNADGPTPSLGG